MKLRFTAMTVCLFCMSLAAFAQGMTDKQVMDYVKSGLAEGKSRSDLIQELMLKGVTKDQAERIRSQYENAQTTGDVIYFDVQDRMHTTSGDVETVAATPLSSGSVEQVEPDKVFGRDIFRNRNLTFAPSENIATPKNYRLGPGDEVIIDIFGVNQNTIRGHISPEGSINVDFLGPVYLNGMTVEEANSYLRKKLSSIYGGLKTDESGRGTDIKLSLGQIRTIQVNALGEVSRPGTYVVSSFSTVFHLLYLAGGVKDPGTLRNILVKRNGKTVGEVDVYNFLVNGNRKSDIRLEEGDVVLVSPYSVMIKVGGFVKRPMYFEMKKGETIADALEYAGGFASSAYTESITLVRQTGNRYEVRTIDSSEFDRFKVQDGDEFTVGKTTSLFYNKTTITGSVFMPGDYELNENMHTVSQLVKAAGGLLPEAFQDRAVMQRELPDKTFEVVPLNIGRIMAGLSPDVELMNNDVLQISDKNALVDRGTMTISGYVSRPGEYPFAENTTIEDLILIAGGLQNGASTARVDISRRVLDPEALEAGSEISQLFSFAIKDGFVEDGKGGFVLEPYDEVTVHRSPSYAPQRHVSVTGEVNFPGTFTMTGREDRISDLIKKAGGLTSFAYPRGARLVRPMSDTEKRQSAEVVRTLYSNDDSASVSDVSSFAAYNVAIDLEAAVANPGSDADIVLREGDQLIVPVYSNVVRVTGAVMNPATLTYKSGKSAGYYIKNCGGYAKRAMKSKAYVIRMNGVSQKVGLNTKIMPGDELIIPKKEKRHTNWGNVVSIGTSIASLGTMVAYLVVATKK